MRNNNLDNPNNEQYNNEQEAENQQYSDEQYSDEQYSDEQCSDGEPYSDNEQEADDEQKADDEQEPMSFWDHLEAFRWMLIRIIGAMAVFVLGGFAFIQQARLLLISLDENGGGMGVGGARRLVATFSCRHHQH